MQILRYAGPFVFLAAIPLLFQVSDAAPLAAPLAILISLLMAHHLPNAARAEPSSLFRVLPILYIPLQLGVILWTAHVVAQPGATSIAFASFAVSVGVCAGVFGVLAAHEMVHSCVRWHNWLGSALLTGMSYRHFRIAHVYGHHRFAATDRDSSTARLGETFYAFLARTLLGQWLEAWRFEQRRSRGKSRPLLRNALVQDVEITTAAYAALSIFWGWRAAEFLAAQSMIAILVLEAFNYVAHYGLVRRVRAGRLEPMGDHHSWNGGGTADLLIFNMGRHSHHHRAPSISYERLQTASRAPTLPGGYAGAILLALIPPLWRAIMDPRALAAGGECESHYARERNPVAAIP